MKNLILAIFIMASVTLKSQARLGSTSKEILDEFSDKSITFDYTANNDLVINVNLDEFYLASYLFIAKSKTCNATLLIPKSDFAINRLVEMYNNQYVIISKTHWRMYSGGSIGDVYLKKSDKGSPYFLWMFSNN